MTSNSLLRRLQLVYLVPEECPKGGVRLILQPLEQRPEFLEVVLDGGARDEPLAVGVEFGGGLVGLGQVVLDHVALV